MANNSTPTNPANVTETREWYNFEKDADGEAIAGRIRARRTGRRVVFDYEVGEIDGLVESLTSIPQSPTRILDFGVERDVTPTHATEGFALPEDVDEQLASDEQELEDAIEADREAYRAAREAEPLTLTVSTTEKTVGRSNTRISKRVLKPSKPEQFWTSDESEVMDALRRALGDANGNPLSEGDDNPFADVADDETFALSEAAGHVDGLDDVRAAIEREREREQARTELVEEHPELRGAGVDPETVDQAFANAHESGDRVTVATALADCDGSESECSTDRVRYLATPENEIEVERTHTY